MRPGCLPNEPEKPPLVVARSQGEAKGVVEAPSFSWGYAAFRPHGKMLSLGHAALAAGSEGLLRFPMHLSSAESAQNLAQVGTNQPQVGTNGH